jgi:hypothetical protein
MRKLRLVSITNSGSLGSDLTSEVKINISILVPIHSMSYKIRQEVVENQPLKLKLTVAGVALVELE